MASLIDVNTIIDMIMNDGIYCDTDADKECSAQEVRELPTVDAIPREQIDEMIKEIETDMSWDMYDENGNETDLHKRLMSIIHKYTDKEQT